MCHHLASSGTYCRDTKAPKESTGNQNVTRCFTLLLSTGKALQKVNDLPRLLTYHISLCQRVHHSAWEVLSVTGAGEQVLAKMFYLPSTTLDKARAVQGLFQWCVRGIFCKVQLHTNKKTEQIAKSVMRPRQCKGLYSREQFRSAHS